METTDASVKSNGVTSSLKPDSKLEQIIHENATDGWEKSWELGVTPWDLGRPTPILMHLHQTGILPKGRALIPGCGSGYDVAAISCAERFVVGLDISENCIKRAMKDLSMSLFLEACFSYIMPLWINIFDTRYTSCPFILLMQLHSSLLGAENFEFVKADFFTWKPTELFNLIFDYTFFCAIEPCMRLAWAKKIDELLKPDGELIILMFPISDHDGGPPYKVSVSDYENVLNPLGFEAVYIEDNELAIGARKGREKLGRWKRSKNRALL